MLCSEMKSHCLPYSALTGRSSPNAFPDTAYQYSLYLFSVVSIYVDL